TRPRKTGGSLQAADKFRRRLDRILPAQLKQVAISAYERIGAASDERCEDRRVLGIARDFNRSRAQIDDFGPDVELAYELLDPLLVPFQLAVDLRIAKCPADLRELLERHHDLEVGLEPRGQNAAQRALGSHQTRGQHDCIENDLHFLRRRVRASFTASSTSASTCFSGTSAKARASSSRIWTGSALSPMMYLHVDTAGDAMATKNLRIELMVSKWGNSLAVRLPAESAKEIGVGEGDTLIAEISPDGRLVLAPEGRAIGKAEGRRLRQFLDRQKETAPVVGDMRRGARY